MRVQARIKFGTHGRTVLPGEWVEVPPDAAKRLAAAGVVVLPGTIEDRDPQPVRDFKKERRK